jgi:hypothetical protein
MFTKYVLVSVQQLQHEIESGLLAGDDVGALGIATNLHQEAWGLVLFCLQFCL